MTSSPVFNLTARARVLDTLDGLAVVLVSYGTTYVGTVTVEAEVGTSYKHLCESAMAGLMLGTHEITPLADAVTEEPAPPPADQSQADVDAAAAAAAAEQAGAD